MPRYARWDVVAVDVPLTEADQTIRRPAVVVSANDLADRHGIYWIVMVTSAENRRWADDIVVSDLGKAGLPKASVVRPVKISTVQEGLISRRLGTLTAKDRQAVHAVLKRCLV